MQDRPAGPGLLPAFSLVLLAVGVVAQGVFRWDLITPAAIGDFLLVGIAGMVVFTASLVRPGRWILDRLAGIRLGVDGILVMVLIGVIVLVF